MEVVRIFYQVSWQMTFQHKNMTSNSHKYNVVRFLCAAALLTGLAAGCGKKVDAGTERAVTSAAELWLGLIDGGKYSTSWNEASGFFRGAVTEQSWENSLNTYRKPLGGLVSRKTKSSQPMTEMPGAPDGQYVVMRFETSFANKKSAVETVTFVLEKDGQWRSSGYFIK